jgi:hypothetical protein
MYSSSPEVFDPLDALARLFFVRLAAVGVTLL